MNAQELNTKADHSGGVIQFKIDYSDEPIELAKLAQSLNSLALHYKRIAKESDNKEEEAVLLVDSISEGAIDCKLVTTMIQATIDGTTKLVSYGKALIEVLNRAKKSEALEDRSRKEDAQGYKDLSSTLGLITANDNAKITINVGMGGKLIVSGKVNSAEAKVAQEALAQRISEIEALRPTSLSR